MDAITGYIAAHPGVLIMIVVFIIILILHFMFKSLIKLALIVLLIFLAAFGYYYLEDPNKMPEKIDKTINMMKSGANEIVDKSKSFFKDTKDLYKESKDVPSDFNKMLKESDKQAGK
jgi:glucan phosphoethanolaminetransferase (alkaline phosphatase superfamily)